MLRRATIPRSGAALVVAALLAVGPLFDEAHRATVRHVTCVEHGELIEAASSPAAEASNEARYVELALAHHHDHCSLAAHRTSPAPLAQPLDPIGEPVRAARDPLDPAIAPPAPVPLLLLAPKSSPPVRSEANPRLV